MWQRLVSACVDCVVMTLFLSLCVSITVILGIRSHFKTSPRAQIRRWGDAPNPQNTISIPAVGHIAPP